MHKHSNSSEHSKAKIENWIIWPTYLTDIIGHAYIPKKIITDYDSAAATNEQHCPGGLKIIKESRLPNWRI
jgi:hypothetical protein